MSSKVTSNDHPQTFIKNNLYSIVLFQITISSLVYNNNKYHMGNNVNDA